jgi:hypothetical protein
MKQFEYAYFEYTYPNAGDVQPIQLAFMNTIGGEGWEVIDKHFSNIGGDDITMYLFCKRELE